MAQTWDTSRTGGGTYEFVQDAQGHYKLQSVGFEKLNKLNLPELKKETITATTDTPKKDTAALSLQTKQAFGDVKPFYYNQEGGADTSPQYTMRKEGDLSTETQPMVTGDTFAQARQKMTTDAAYTGQPDLTKLSPEITLPGTPKWAQGADKRGYENIGKEVKSTNQIGRRNVDEVLAARKDPNRFTGIVGPQKPSPYQDAIMRGETGVKYEKPEKPEIQKTVTTQLKKVNTALGPLAKAVGFVMNPVKGLVGAAVGMVTETPTQKHAKKYFNADDQTGRISGNPATDLYAGMNRVSAMGNLERAGERRIETREKTIEKKGYGPGDKFYDDTQKMKDQQKNYKDSKDNEPSINPSKAATVSRTNKDYGQFGRRQQHTAAGGGNGGGGGGRVICTELHRTHELSTKDWIRDVHFTFNTLTENHIKGYLIWAIPTVKHMKKYPKYRKIWKHIAQHRANDIAWRLNEGKFDLLGRIYAGIGEPLCWLIGNFTGNKQINELNIKNWRKA